MQAMVERKMKKKIMSEFFFLGRGLYVIYELGSTFGVRNKRQADRQSPW